MSSNRSKTTGSIVAYKLVHGASHAAVDLAVRKLMDEGWKVHHGPHVVFFPPGDGCAPGLCITQAMVRYSEPDSGLKG